MSPPNFPNTVWDGDSDNRNSDEGRRAAPDHRDWTRIIGEIKATQQKILDDIHDGTGNTAIVDGLSVQEVGDNALHRTTLIFEDMVINITDAGVNGAHGFVKLYTFPQTIIQFLSVILSLTNIEAGTGGIANNAILDIAAGSTQVVTDNDVLSLTEQDISTKLDITLSGGKKSGKVHNTTIVILDGSTSPIEIFLNVAVEDASCDANDTLTINGRLILLWSNCNCPLS